MIHQRKLIITLKTFILLERAIHQRIQDAIIWMPDLCLTVLHFYAIFRHLIHC